MRVLVFTNMWPSDSAPAAGSFVAEQVADLRAAGVDTDVLAFDGRTSSFNYAGASLSIRRRVREGYDVVHAHYGLTGLVAMSQRAAPVVTTFHGSDVGYIPWQARISWLVARRTTPIFVNRAHAQKLGLPTAAIIPAGVDVSVFAPRPRQEARRALGWDEDARYVLLPGSRRAAVKDPELYDRTMDLVSSQTPDVRPVSLEGFSRQQVVDVMSAVDVLLVTSRSEGSPVSVKEALACGTPVVTVPVGDVPDVIGGLPGCATCARDPMALADAVVAALNATDRLSLRRRAEEYERKRLADRVLDVYAEAARPPRRARTGSHPSASPVAPRDGGATEPAS